MPPSPSSPGVNAPSERQEQVRQQEQESDSQTSSSDERQNNDIRHHFRMIYMRAMLLMHQHNNNESNLINAAPCLPTKKNTSPFRTLTLKEATALSALCRFCFEGASADHTLASPCNCSGSGQWIHLTCLRQWQQRAADNICSVCRAPYQVDPPPPRRLRHPIAKGNLLISTDDHHLPVSTFYQKVILILHTRSSGPMGFILNSPADNDPMEIEFRTPQASQATSVRRGGPVCGGRLGLTKYFIMYKRDSQDAAEEPLCQPYSSVSILDSDRQGWKLLTTSRRDQSPACLSAQQVQDVTHKLSSHCQICVFKGYCKWRRGQLEQELLDGTWSVCDSTTANDLEGDNNLWTTFQDNPSRLKEDADLFE